MDEWIIKLGNKCYRAEIQGDPGRTTQRKWAKRYSI